MKKNLTLLSITLLTSAFAADMQPLTKNKKRKNLQELNPSLDKRPQPDVTLKPSKPRGYNPDSTNTSKDKKSSFSEIPVASYSSLKLAKSSRKKRIDSKNEIMTLPGDSLTELGLAINLPENSASSTSSTSSTCQVTKEQNTSQNPDCSTFYSLYIAPLDNTDDEILTYNHAIKAEAETYFLNAKNSYEKKNMTEVIKWASKAFTSNTLDDRKKALSYVLIGSACDEMNKLDNAIKFYQRALNTGKLNILNKCTVLNSMGIAYLKKNDFSNALKATECFENALKISNISEILYTQTRINLEIAKRQEMFFFLEGTDWESEDNSILSVNGP